MTPPDEDDLDAAMRAWVKSCGTATVRLYARIGVSVPPAFARDFAAKLEPVVRELATRARATLADAEPDTSATAIPTLH